MSKAIIHQPHANGLHHPMANLGRILLRSRIHLSQYLTLYNSFENQGQYCTPSVRPIRDAIKFPSQRYGATSLPLALRHTARVNEGHGIRKAAGVEDQKVLGVAWQAIELA